MMRPEKSYTGNARFYGFCVDLLEEVAKMVGFHFRLELVPDGVYGVKNPFTGEWNGIVRQLMTRVREVTPSWEQFPMVSRHCNLA